MHKLIHFIQYNNAVPIALGILFLGAGGVFAATNPEMILESQQEIVSIDNTYIANKDIDAFTPRVQITEVTEDDESYFVAYKFTTIDLVDAVWQDVDKQESMQVSKADLGEYRDLGLYVMEQLQQKIDREIAYLEEVQGFEKKSITQKTVATKYSGLVGKMMDDKTETLPGYTPVVKEDKSVAKWQKPSDENNESGITNNESNNENNESRITNYESVTNPNGPSIQILGNNPAWIRLRTQYSDLGALAYNKDGKSMTIKLLLDGEEVNRVEISTATSSEHTVIYRSTDGDGNTNEAARKVVVYDPAKQTPPDSTIVPAPVIADEPEPAPVVEETPEPVVEEEEVTTSATTATTELIATSTDSTSSPQVATTTEPVEEETATTTATSTATSTESN